jgi:hypothetical protein
MEKKKIILPTKKYFKALEEDLSIKVSLDKEETLLREGDTNIIIDVAELFNTERNESKKYKIYGKIAMIFKNLYTGNTEYNPLMRNLYLNGDGSVIVNEGYMPYNEFAFFRNDVLREVNQINAGSTPTFSQNLTLSGYTGHTTVTALQAAYHNWNIYLTYIHAQDDAYPISYTLSGGTTYNFTAGDGIPFMVVDNGNYYSLISSVEHGINENEYVIISGITLNNTIPISGRTFYVDTIGDEMYNSEKYVINVLKNQFSGTTLINDGDFILCKRCVDKNNISGTTSQYYVHKHKTLTTTKDYIADKIGFESLTWHDEKKLLFKNSEDTYDFLVEKNRMESMLYDFKETFILSGITNNLGYTPTEVYVSIVFRNGNGYFYQPAKVGYKFHFHDTWIDNHFSGNTSNETNLSGHTFTSNTTTDTFTGGTSLDLGTILTGAFVEYNESELKERIISESYYKIVPRADIFYYNQNNPSYYSGASNDNMFGLFFQPHHRVKLRQLSPYVETSKTNILDNLPQNSKFYQNEGLWKWRDLYDHGYIDTDGYGTDYPFVNGIHHIKNNINFYLRNESKFINKVDGIEGLLNKNFKNKITDC